MSRIVIPSVCPQKSKFNSMTFLESPGQNLHSVTLPGSFPDPLTDTLPETLHGPLPDTLPCPFHDNIPEAIPGPL